MEEKLLSVMNEYLADDTAVSSDPDDDGLPFEPFDAFSTDPAEFGEMGQRMLSKVENIFDLTRVYNRHSAKYLKACTLLDKGIRMLGSVCVTRSAMEVSKYPLPELGQLTTRKLYSMASFNYRKLDTALTERLQKGNDLYPELTEMFFRYFNLLHRLRATEVRIHRYYIKKYYEREDYGPVIKGLAFSKKSWTKSYTTDREEAPAFRSAPAFPLLKSEIGNQKQGIREKDSDQKESGKVRKADADAKPGIAGSRPLPFNCQMPAANRRPIIPDCQKPAGDSGQTLCVGGPDPKPTGAGNDKSDVHDCGSVPASGIPAADRRLPACTGNRGSCAAGKEEAPPGTELRDSIGILRDAVRRSAGKSAITFTENEILALAADPYFSCCCPELADPVRQAAAKIRNTGSGN